MSQKLEKAFRDALQNKEVPFDPSAWEKMSARLDQIMPVAPKATSTSSTWWIAASAVGVLTIGAVAYFSNKGVSDNLNQSEITQITQVTQEKLANPTTQNENFTEEKTASNQEPIQKESRPSLTSVQESKTTPNQTAEVKSIGKPANIEPTEKNPANNTNQNDSPTNGLNKKGFVLPKVTANCQGEELTLSNSNDEDLLIKTPAGKNIVIKANSSKKVVLNETGNYTVASKDFSSKMNFNIKPQVAIDLEIGEMNEYVDGVPTLKAFAHGGTGDFTWNVDAANLKLKGQDVQMNLFKKGKYEIELKSGGTECPASLSKTIFVEEDYNLLAMKGFRPLDNDPRVQTFMPFSLTQRKTPFRMIIIDPRNGQIVFQTTDENIGWDGVDRKTGKLVEANSNYKWKVSLDKPLPGESTTYSGDVTVVY